MKWLCRSGEMNTTFAENNGEINYSKLRPQWVKMNKWRKTGTKVKYIKILQENVQFSTGFFAWPSWGYQTLIMLWWKVSHARSSYYKAHYGHSEKSCGRDESFFLTHFCFYLKEKGTGNKGEHYWDWILKVKWFMENLERIFSSPEAKF